MQQQKNHRIKSFFTVLMITLICFGLIGVNSIKVYAQAPGIIVVIGSDTIWTKADSHYEITGPIFVSNDATLTIDSGAVLNFNGYYLLVNGTLRVLGSETDSVHINNVERIEFTKFSQGWNEQTDSGCVIEYATISCGLMAGNIPIRLIGCNFDGDVAVGSSSVISGCSLGDVSSDGAIVVSDNAITGKVSADGSVVVNNTIAQHVYCGHGSLISHNTIGGSVNAGEVTNNKITGTYLAFKDYVPVVSGDIVSNNSIIGRVSVQGPAIVSNNNIQGNYTMIVRDLVGYMGMRSSVAVYYGSINVQLGSPQIFNNVVDGGITTSGPECSPIITNNTVINSGIFIPCPRSDTEYILSGVPSIGSGGSPEIYDNTVDGLIEVSADSCKISGNIAKGIKTVRGTAYVSNNVVNDGKGIDINSAGIVESNYLFNNTSGIIIRDSSSMEVIKNTIVNVTNSGLHISGVATARNNTITNCTTGVSIRGNAFATIERNHLYKNLLGVLVSAQADIKNNTIAYSEIAIKLEKSSDVIIRYNNLENYSQYSIYLFSVSNKVDLADNWWGTVDAQAINVSIRDYKYDFSLGKVSFNPFLTRPNTEATTNPIPEFFSWIVLPLFLVASLVVVIIKSKIVRRNNN